MFFSLLWVPVALSDMTPMVHGFLLFCSVWVFGAPRGISIKSIFRPSVVSRIRHSFGGVFLYVVGGGGGGVVGRSHVVSVGILRLS